MKLRSDATPHAFVAGLVLLVGSTCAVAGSPSSAENLAPVFRQVSAAVGAVRWNAHGIASIEWETGQHRGTRLGRARQRRRQDRDCRARRADCRHRGRRVCGSGPRRGGGHRFEPAADVALLQVQRVPDGVKPAKLGDSDKVQIGEQVFVVGAPLGITHTLTAGHLSARHKPNATFSGMLTAEFFRPMRQSTAATPVGRCSTSRVR